MIDLFLAEGFEEIEALAPLDILRRAGLEVQTVGVGSAVIHGSHGIPVVCDTVLDAVSLSDKPEAVILPGGMPGTLNLEKSEKVCAFVKDAFEDQRLICAICAAPSVFGHLGLLNGKHATCFPGFEKDLFGAIPESAGVCKDGQIITAKGAGVAPDFGFAIMEAFCGIEKTQALRASMQFNS